MYFIIKGLGSKWKPLAIFFSSCAMIGALPVFNVNQLTQALNDILLKPNGVEVTDYTNLGIGFFLVLITSIVVLGGLKRIGMVTARLVPSMVILYFILVVIILIVNIDVVPKYFLMIFTDAFSADFINEESVMGGVVGALIILGIKRGAFSNEAGVGNSTNGSWSSKNR